MLETKAYWIDRSRWPRETRSHLPLAQAVLDIGAATIEGWTGNEAEEATKLASGISPYDKATRADRCRANAYLSEAYVTYQERPKHSPRSASSVFVTGPLRSLPEIEDYHISREEYADAIAVIGKRSEKFAPAARRFEEAKREFLRAATMGEFGTAVREGSSYQTRALDPDIWSIVAESSVFVFCMINPTQPNSAACGGMSFLPVMVERTSLSAWLAERQRPNGSAIPEKDPGARSINDPIGPMNPDVRAAISTASDVLRAYKLETEDAVFQAIKATGNPISRRAFDEHVIAPARAAAGAPARRGPRPKQSPAIGEG